MSHNQARFVKLWLVFVHHDECRQFSQSAHEFLCGSSVAVILTNHRSPFHNIGSFGAALAALSVFKQQWPREVRFARGPPGTNVRR